MSSLEASRTTAKGRPSFTTAGRTRALCRTFASEESYLLHLSQSNPRRKLQQLYVAQKLKIAEVPDTARVTKEYPPKELSIEEASLLARVIVTLSEDYLLPDFSVLFADITHKVPILVGKEEGLVRIWLAKGSSMVKPVLEAYRTAFEVFGGFVKDFVRTRIYNKISNYIPSSTREGTDALAKLLQRNRELYRYEESELGNLEPLLGEYLAGEKTLVEVLTFARAPAVLTPRPYDKTKWVGSAVSRRCCRMWCNRQLPQKMGPRPSGSSRPRRLSCARKFPAR